MKATKQLTVEVDIDDEDVSKFVDTCDPISKAYLARRAVLAMSDFDCAQLRDFCQDDIDQRALEVLRRARDRLREIDDGTG